MIGDYVVTEGVFKSALEGLQLCLHPNWILSNSVHELDFGAVGAMPPQFSRPLPIGPILPIDVLQMPSTNKISCRASLWHEEDSCLQWLDEQKPQSVLYVSLGSIAILDKEQLKELAVALEASELPILWVLRDDLTGSKGTFLPDDFQDRTRKMIRIISWSPQLLVLAHKAVGGFLTHAGWNSTLEALSMGVPMLVWPHLGDQFLNAELVVGEWGVGLELNLGNKDFIGKNCIESQVRKLMEEHEGEVLRAKAKEIRQQILTAVAEGGSSYNNLQSFVTWVKRQAQIL
ncbi:hypothetical protein KP509_05G076400 [Ceratopteris richardii]|nr:hypothetical protein KP509_05G076400 [Ceratopteris richardii]